MGYLAFAEDGAAPIKAWVHGVPFEEQARQQLINISRLPFIHKWVAVMPDVHLGKGATVGSVIATKGAIVPAAVGVDIGCGVSAVKTNLVASDLPDNLRPLRDAIENTIPVGRTNDGRDGDRGAWGDPPEVVERAYHEQLSDGYTDIILAHPGINRNQHPVNQLGTLGTGNHFIEVCLDEQQSVWAMLHSGSRGVGARIGQHFINLAKADMRRFFINLPDEDLAYLPEGTDHFRDYCRAVAWAQNYASISRALMMDMVIGALGKAVRPTIVREQAISCHHNYVSHERHYGADVLVTRKGAVSAKEGEYGLIPGSMGAKSYVVKGLGCPESFGSCSHGAGRAMSRGEAKRRFTLADHEAATAGVECRKDADVLDETPGAYKDVDAVMEAQRDLVEVVHTLRGVLCVKG